jgi:hypothetical protein
MYDPAARANAPIKFFRPPCWYYSLQKIKTYYSRVEPNSTKTTPNLVHIRDKGSRDDSCGRTDRHGQLCVRSFHVSRAKKAEMNAAAGLA